MARRKFPLASGLALVVAIAVLPLAGVACAGRDLSHYFQFPPPLEIPRDYVRWSWLAAALIVLPFGLIAFSWTRCSTRRAEDATSTRSVARPAVAFGFPKYFPFWGWLALGWVAIWWILAWTRLPWFADLQRYTFFPLWLGFIIAVNALTLRASGTCELIRDPRSWLRRFVASAGFWWMFEWLNRFVHNWHYLAAEEFSAVGYIVHATLCFSTVLPAVAAVSEWIGSLNAQSLVHAKSDPTWPWLERRTTGVTLLLGGILGLGFTGVWPRQFFPALWAAPLAIAWGAEIATRRPGVWNELARGDWRRISTWALAALVCGFFWELWNFHSLAKWIYTVPYVDRWHVFEMPLLGYLGYLPFGIECLVVNDWLDASPSGHEPATQPF